MQSAPFGFIDCATWCGAGFLCWPGFYICRKYANNVWRLENVYSIICNKHRNQQVKCFAYYMKAAESAKIFASASKLCASSTIPMNRLPPFQTEWAGGEGRGGRGELLFVWNIPCFRLLFASKYGNFSRSDFIVSVCLCVCVFLCAKKNCVSCNRKTIHIGWKRISYIFPANDRIEHIRKLKPSNSEYERTKINTLRFALRCVFCVVAFLFVSYIWYVCPCFSRSCLYVVYVNSGRTDGHRRARGKKMMAWDVRYDGARRPDETGGPDGSHRDARKTRNRAKTRLFGGLAKKKFLWIPR